jgi:uncharacterized protein YunC (DUF1805 family)
LQCEHIVVEGRNEAHIIVVEYEDVRTVLDRIQRNAEVKEVSHKDDARGIVSTDVVPELAGTLGAIC